MRLGMIGLGRMGIGDIPRTPGRERAKGTAEQGYLHRGPNGAGHFVKTTGEGAPADE